MTRGPPAFWCFLNGILLLPGGNGYQCTTGSCLYVPHIITEKLKASNLRHLDTLKINVLTTKLQILWLIDLSKHCHYCKFTVQIKRCCSLEMQLKTETKVNRKKQLTQGVKGSSSKQTFHTSLHSHGLKLRSQRSKETHRGN